MKINRKKIYNKYDKHCAYCGKYLEENRWHVDHIEPAVRGLKTGKYPKEKLDREENLNPSCPSCNLMKHSFTLEQFRENIEKYIDSLNRYNNQYSFAKKYGLVKETGKKVKFYFETLKEKN